MIVPRSLSGRLLAGSALATLLALGLMLVLMHEVLQRFVTGQIDQRLDNKIVALASQLRAAPDGTLSLDGEADGPPFDRPRHRSFWVVQGPRDVLKTRWLADGDIVIPSAATIDQAFAGPARPPGPAGLESHPRTLAGKGFGGIVLHERVARSTVGSVPVTILVAAPAEAIAGPVGEAMTTVGLGVLALGLALGALAFAQVRLGLKPLTELRAQVAEVCDGRRARLPSEQPGEIAPLVAEMNRLLERNAANLDKARRHVANLAHGLKTPLATLALAVERMDGPGKEDLRLLLGDIDGRVRHHLGRARAAALAGPERARTPLAARFADLGDALRRIHADRGITLAFQGETDLTLACEGNDLDEIFGNLLDNAFKFARTRVTCRARRDGRFAYVAVADDGPGLTAADIAMVMQPGRRLDERVPGFGFGLAIARELVELYGGELTLEPGTAGLVAAVTLPLSGS
jgi:signal transduction histidine kinase